LNDSIYPFSQGLPGSIYSVFTPILSSHFLIALVSEEQMENTKHMRALTEENRTLKPFKAFLSEPCEICHEPIKEWDDYNVKLAIQGIGFGHTAGWRSDLGRMKEFARALAKLREEAK
jgi:hypothetical protein